MKLMCTRIYREYSFSKEVTVTEEVLELDLRNQQVWTGHEHREKDGCSDWIVKDYLKFSQLTSLYFVDAQDNVIFRIIY